MLKRENSETNIISQKNEEIISINQSELQLIKNELDDLKIKIQNLNQKKKSYENEILDTILYPDSIKFIKNSLIIINIWSFFKILFMTLKYFILVLALPILTFSSTKYTDLNLNYYAGIASICCIAFEKLSIFCSNNSNNRIEKLNIMIKQFGVNYEIPEENIQIVSTEPISDSHSNSNINDRKIVRDICLIQYQK